MAIRQPRPPYPRPVQHLAAVARDYPEVWKLLDGLRAERGRGLPKWADWCFLPMAAAYAIVSGGGDNRVPIERMPEIGRVAALASWRVSQGIYRFDPALLDALWDTPLTGKLPIELFFRLPEWCVYVETPGRQLLGAELHGFYAHLEDDQNEGESELRFLFDLEIGLVPSHVHLVPEGIEESWRVSVAEGAKMLDSLIGKFTEHMRDIPRPRIVSPGDLPPFLSVVLYLCSTEPDIRGGVEWAPARPTRPHPTKTKAGLRWFPPDRPTVWDIGLSIGEALRRSSDRERAEWQGGTHASPRAHIRRGHWHAFRIGKGSRTDPSKARLELKWLHPMLVGDERM